MTRSATATGERLFLVATTLEAVVPLARNIILARLLPPEHFGFAIAIALVLGTLEVLSDFGVPIFAMRRSMAASHSNTLATLHTCALLRACGLAALLAGGGPLFATLLHAEVATSGFVAMGLVALIRGFENLSVKASIRMRRFRMEALLSVFSQIALLSTTAVAAILTKSYTAMVYGLLAHSIAVVLFSHILSPRPWRLGWKPEIAIKIWQFGWPLLLNGAAVAVASGDRIAVANIMGPATLAQYNVAVGSAMLPRSVLARFLTSLFVPRFARASALRHSHRALANTWVFCLSGIAFAAGLSVAVIGGPALGLVFGAHYVPDSTFMTALGFAVAVRFGMLLPVPYSIARGETGVLANVSLASAMAILISIPVLIHTRSPAAFVLVQASIEYAALVVVCWRGAKRGLLTPSLLGLSVLLPTAVLGTAAFAAAFVSERIVFAPVGFVSASVFICAALAFAIIRRAYGINLQAVVR